MAEAETPRDGVKRRKDAHRRKRRTRKHQNQGANGKNNGGKRPGSCNQATGQCRGAACNASFCPNGCCDAYGACQPGNTVQQCGSDGIACFRCGPNQSCSKETGSCRDNPPCSAATCPDGCCDDQNGIHVCVTNKRGCAPGGACCAGCCDEHDACHEGKDDGACGAGGDVCVECPAGATCTGQGTCQCRNTNEFCGSGDTCIACPPNTVCNAQGECICTDETCPRSSGRTCQNNRCVCEDAACNGCCLDDICYPGKTPQACGNGGDCTVCGEGEICLDGHCCPAGTTIICNGDITCCPAGTKSCCFGVCCASEFDGCTPFGVCCAGCDGSACVCGSNDGP